MGRRGHKRRKPFNNFSIDLAYINIRGMLNKLAELNCLTDQLSLINGSFPSILAVTETWETLGDDIPFHPMLCSRYSWLGKPAEKLVTCGRPSGGFGFWIHKSVTHCCVITHPKDKHEAIMWVHYTTREGDFFISLLYSPKKGSRGQDGDYDAILSTLEKNLKQFQPLGTCLILGDFNCRLPSRTGDHVTNSRTTRMEEFLSRLDLSVLRNPSCEVGDLHYTCLPERGGKSIPDLIIHQRQASQNFTNYKV